MPLPRPTMPRPTRRRPIAATDPTPKNNPPCPLQPTGAGNGASSPGRTKGASNGCPMRPPLERVLAREDRNHRPQQDFQIEQQREMLHIGNVVANAADGAATVEGGATQAIALRPAGQARPHG